MNELDTLKANAEAAYAQWRSYDTLRPHDMTHDLRREELQIKLTLAEQVRRQAQTRIYAGR